MEKETAIKVFDEKELMPNDEWETLLKDCEDAIIEGVTAVRGEVIRMKWELGEILFDHGEEQITKLLSRVAVELKQRGHAVSEPELWRCLKLRKKFPTLKQMWSELPEGKNISWHKLVHNYIDFSVPKPAVLMEEKFDEFGLIDWWLKLNPVPVVVRVRDKNSTFALIVRPCRQKASDKPAEKLGKVFEDLDAFYIKLKKWDAKDLNSNDYARMNKAIKELLEKASYDKERVRKAIQWCYDKYLGTDVDWSINTVVKKFAEAVRVVKPHEKYLQHKKGAM